MLNRFTRGVAAVAGTLLVFGAAGTMMAGAAGAVTVISTTNTAGYQSGNGAYEFRYVTATFTVPESACSAGSNFVTAGVELVGEGTVSNATLEVACAVVGGVNTPYVSWTTLSLGHASGNPKFLVADDDSITVSIYYDSTTGYDYFYATNNTTSGTDTWAHKAGAAEYRYVLAGATVPNPLATNPGPGYNYILVPFTGVGITSLDGTHGTGMNGPWGYDQVNAYNGAHLIASAPVIYTSWSQFNVRVYGTA